ncbi:hypothetical protein Desor_1841 [Desulfosporosinus orientis DSM 765]|uniref:Uncharacterized protein n=1 Tax=Desulfosporosinus orientis (strain ATCC 19365 / DSM 765 / NCIMB 8382 / VKM B-1628 / Singapore I) TaxID=768706 RepID=G7WAX4_DESOD|nr:hypothetical protein Desor_1841 [Desulfosporosinus orientis DSM 765]
MRNRGQPFADSHSHQVCINGAKELTKLAPADPEAYEKNKGLWIKN